MADRLNAGLPVVFQDGTMQFAFRDWLLRVRDELDTKVTLVDTPATLTSPGAPGEFAYDDDWIYVCIDVDTWKKTPIQGDVLYADMLAPVGGASVPPNNAPSLANFGPIHTPQRREWAFDVGEYVFIQPFHINHDIKPNGKAYIHVHWSSSGVDTGLVAWELTIMRALGHDQANFGTPFVITLEQAGSGTAWRHMIVEATELDVITMSEPDELILVTLRRVSPSAGANSDTIFGLMLDLHYEIDRIGTINKAPNFYG